MRQSNRSTRSLLSLAGTAILASTAVAQSFQGMGDLSGGTFGSFAYGVSADGRTVVGSSVNAAGTVAVYWRDGTLTSLGDVAGGPVESYAASSNYDGTVFVGTGRDGTAHRPLRWGGPGYAMTQLPQVPGFTGGGTALGISADGRVICGYSTDNQLTAYANITGYRIDEGVLTGLPFQIGSQVSDSAAYGSPSGNGSVLVGRVHIGSALYQGCYWVGTTLHQPPDLSPGFRYSQIFAASDDGTVLVGTSCSPAAPTNYLGEPCRWENDVPMGLGAVPGGSAVGNALGCSRGGTIVVGNTTVAGASRAFIWTAGAGMRELALVLSNDYGLNLAGWTLQRASAITPDGSVIVGYGLNPDGHTEGWIARLSCTTLATHCTAKTNALGCVPKVGGTGTPSATATSGFLVHSSNMRNNKAGLLLYGANGAANTPFQGGKLCVASPIKRTTALNSGGSATGSDCTGIFTIDMNAFARGLLGGSPLPALSVPGTMIDCQFWGRDPGYAAPNNTQLSDGLRFIVCN